MPMILQILLSGIFIGIYYIFFNHYSRKHDIFILMSYSLIITGVLGGVFFGGIENPLQFSHESQLLLIGKICLYTLAFYLLGEGARRLSDMHTGLIRTTTIITSLILGWFLLGKGIHVWQGIGIVVIVISTLFGTGSLRKLTEPIHVGGAIMVLTAGIIGGITSVMDALILREIPPIGNVIYFCFGIGALFFLIHIIRCLIYKKKVFTSIPLTPIILLSVSLLLGDYFLYASFLHEASTPGILLALRKVSIVVVGAYGFLQNESDRNTKALAILGGILGFVIISLGT